MYQANNAGRGRTEYFRAELATAVRRRLELDADLRGACDGRGLELYMQPVVAMQHEGRITGAEALLRWNHPRLGLLAPDAFIPVAEDTGLIVPIGRWVLRNAAEAAVRWNCGRTRPLRVSVNISTCQFVLDDVADVVRETLQATGGEPGWLVAEITESLLLEDTERVRCQIDTLRRLGVAVAIDDFGIGYSALHYLTRLRVDLLKIDKCFVHGIVGNERGGELVKAFIAMARALDLEVVAEGVETLAQAHFLLEHGCRYGQGYKFGRPMPVPAFEALLAETAPAVPAVPA
jgi:EAL domain-containing protein (putative c-di-GMP-specific phosphodiesterase class I)